MGTNAAGEGPKELRDRDEEEGASPPGDARAWGWGCEVAKGLVFWCQLSQAGTERKGDCGSEEAGAGWAVLGTSSVELKSDRINKCLQQILDAILRDSKSITQGKKT